MTPLRLALVLLAGATLAGCASESDATKKRINTLEQELTQMQNGYDRLEERLSAMEARGASAEPSQPAAAETNVIERPPLKVVRVGPGATTSQNPAGGAASGSPGNAGASDADDAETRPLITGTGDRIETRGFDDSKSPNAARARASKPSQTSRAAAPKAPAPSQEAQ